MKLTEAGKNIDKFQAISSKVMKLALLKTACIEILQKKDNELWEKIATAIIQGM